MDSHGRNAEDDLLRGSRGLGLGGDSLQGYLLMVV